MKRFLQPRSSESIQTASVSSGTMTAVLLTLLCLLLCETGIQAKATHRRAARLRQSVEGQRRLKTAQRTRRRASRLRAANPQTALSSSSPAQMPLWNAGEEDVEKRIEWNLFKRTYPFASLPTQARRKAWESMQSSLSAPRGKEAGILSGLSDNAPVWSAVGPNPTVMTVSFAQGNIGAPYSGRINTIAVSPADPQLVLIGAATGGIWRSTDGGESFVPVSDDQIDMNANQ